MDLDMRYDFAKIHEAHQKALHGNLVLSIRRDGDWYLLQQGDWVYAAADNLVSFGPQSPPMSRHELQQYIEYAASLDASITPLDVVEWRVLENSGSHD